MLIRGGRGEKVAKKGKKGERKREVSAKKNRRKKGNIRIVVGGGGIRRCFPTVRKCYWMVVVKLLIKC